MIFSFATADRVTFGAGAADDLSTIAAGFGPRVLLVLGSSRSADEAPVAGVGEERVVDRVAGEPTVQGVADAVAAARELGPDVIVGVGGGSVIDTAKSVGILLRNGGEPLDYLEVVGDGKPLAPDSVPVIAVPTTAGTGAEVTANAPLLSPEHGLKASLRSPAMIPAHAVVDPLLPVSSPPAVTASSGLDALTQCLEPYTSWAANPVTDLFAAEGLRRASTGLRAAYADGSDVEARTDMALVSLLGGMALANAKLGAAHGLAAPLGGMIEAAHGEICAAVLAAATEVNVRALTEREPGSVALTRYTEASRLLTGDGAATVDDGVAWIRETARLLEVRTLGEIGLTPDRVAEAAAKGRRASSMKGNPVELIEAEVVEIVERSM
ncbi:MAG: iron-containing alcohol dehydrogenase [Actinomycetaceae bacterium]